MAKRNITAILVTAGISSRFKPLSDNYHKTLLKVGGEALITRTIRGLVKNGVKDMVLVHAPGDKERFIEALRGTGARINYILLKTPLSTGIALKVALPKIRKNRDLLILNGGQLKTGIYIKQLLSSNSPKDNLKILATKSNRPWDYAILKFADERAAAIEKIIEKPAVGTEPSKMRTAGIYFAPAEFRQYILKEKESPNSLINAFNKYIKDFGGTAVKLNQEPTSIKYAFDLIDVIVEFTNGLKKNISKKARIHKYATINGNVVVGDGTIIKENAVIHGPVYIGKDCKIGDNAVIRENSVIEDNVHLGVNTEVKKSYVGVGTHIHSGYIGDSIIAENCRIGAGFITANRRTDRKNIKFSVKDRVVESGKSYLGCVVGSETKIGIRASTMPGTIIGSNCVVGPNTEVNGTIPSNSIIYTKSKNIIRKNGK